jgi:hypothetical protein
MTVPRDRREREEYMAARFEEMAPRAMARLNELVEKGDRRALKLLDRIERERPDLLPSARRSTKEQEGARTRAAS